MIPTCQHCEHWRASAVKSPTIGRCAQRIRTALAIDLTVPMSRVQAWTNPNDTCDEWTPRE